MSLLQVWFDGQELTQFMKVTMGVDRTLLPERIDDAGAIGNRDGQHFNKHSYYGTRSIEVPFIIDETNIRNKATELARILFVKEPKQLIFSDQPDRYWMAMPDTSTIPYSEDDVLNVEGTLKFICYDPFAYAVNVDTFEHDSDEQKIVAQSDFNGKVAGNTSPVPHVIYQGKEPNTVAMTPPSGYSSEISTNLYAALKSVDQQSASVQSTVERKTAITQSVFPLANDSAGPAYLDEFSLQGTNINIRGWFAWEGYATHPYNYIIITDDDWRNEYARVKVTLQDSPDVDKVYTNFNNSKKCRFVGTLPYVKGMGNKDLRIHFRYSDSENGEGDWCNATFIASSEDDWQQTAPHLMVKFDVLNAFEQSKPGFWNKYQVYGREAQTSWLKGKLDSARFNAWVNGSGASGNNATMQVWDQKNSWVGKVSTNSATPSLLSYNYTTSDELFTYISADGYMYFNIFPQYQITSDTKNSVINLDYFEGELTVNLPAAAAITINNNGYLPVSVEFEITNHGQNGFIGVQSQDRNVLIGNPNEVDGGVVSQSETLFQTDKTATDLTQQFKINGGVTGGDEDIRQVGDLRVGNTNGMWAAVNGNEDGKNHFGAATSGTGRGWHGPSLHRDFFDDTNGTTGADNFTCVTTLWWNGNVDQSGLTNIVMNGANGEKLATVQFYKGQNENTTFLIRNSDDTVIYIDSNNPRWNNFIGVVNIQRFGDVWTIDAQDTMSGSDTRETRNFNQTESGKIKVTGWTYQKCQWSGVEPIASQDFYDMWFRKENVDKYVDVPNTFKDGDVITIGGGENKVTTSVNGALNLSLQDVGSRPIMANRGTTVVSFLTSTFAEAPDVKAKIRKKYL